MVHPATGFCICVSVVAIFCTLLCLADCGKCPREGVHKSLNHGACSSYSSFLSFDYGSGHQKTVPVDDNACSRSELCHFLSTFYGFRSEAQCLKAGNLDVNRSECGAALPKQSIRSDGNVSWCANDVVFRLVDGGNVACSSNFRESGHEKLTPIVKDADHVVLSSCREHLLYKKETSFSLQKIDIEKSHSPSSDSSYLRVSISPSKLNWGRSFLYHPSVASLRLKNTCNESTLVVYEPFSTDSQFYPFNFSEVVLGPGEVTSMSFAYLPNRLGLSSAELVLHTSFGGFLVKAKGFSVESPYRLRPLVGLDASFGGWLSRKLSLSNPFDDTIDLEEVTALVSVFENSGSLLVETICRKQNSEGSNKHILSSVHKVADGDIEQLKSMVMAVTPLNNWLITPHRTQSIMEMSFLPDSEQRVEGAICMELFRPLEGEKDILVVPFEAELSKTTTWNNTASSLSVSVEAVGPCDASETTISVSVRNKASHLLKIVKINEVVDSKKLLQIKYMEGLLLFPYSVSQVALVTYESSTYDSFLEIPDVNTSCKLDILVNDSISPLLEVPCLEIFGICPRRQRASFFHMPDVVDPSNRTGYLSSYENSPVLNKALGIAEADEFVRERWTAQSTMSGFYLLDNQELLFPLIPIGKYHAKSITLRNPSQQPVIVQLILSSGESVDNCKTCYDHQNSPSLSSSICNDSTRVNKYGFSVADSTVTEAFLHPNGTASLGPILFHPSNRCEWKISAFIRSNLSGLEMLSLRGFGGSLSLVILEGSELMQRLEFNINLPFPLNVSKIEDVISNCRKPLSKKLFAVNAGDFPVQVKRIDVSGRECGLDGFVVHNCRGFSLEPGESFELGLSYQSDFSTPVVKRELELILAVGILVIPIQASIPLNTIHLCSKSIIWLRLRKYSLAIVLAAVLISLLFWFTMPSYFGSCLIKSEKRSIPVARSVLHNLGNGKVIQPTKRGHMKQKIIADHVEGRAEINLSSDTVKVTSSPFKSKSVENAGKTEVGQPVCLTVKTRKEKRRRSRKRNALIEVCSSHSGNSTPSSPLSPITTLSPPETYSPSTEKMQSRDSFSPEPPSVPGNHQKLSPGGSRKTGTQSLLSASVTFPGTRICSSRLAVAPHVRAPGPMIDPKKAVETEEKAWVEEDRFTYDIWGNHFSGLHLCRPNSSFTITSGDIDHSSSFFFWGPQQTLMTNSQPTSVSSYCDEG